MGRMPRSSVRLSESMRRAENLRFGRQSTLSIQCQHRASQHWNSLFRHLRMVGTDKLCRSGDEQLPNKALQRTRIGRELLSLAFRPRR
jgi:hypothetical protein